MNPFPKEAWPALAVFAADRLVALQLRFDGAAPRSEEQSKVQVEIKEFIEEFKNYAAPLVAESRRRQLARVVELVKIKQNQESQFLDKSLNELCGADLTRTEKIRLVRLRHEIIDLRIDQVFAALKALQDSEKLRS